MQFIVFSILRRHARSLGERKQVMEVIPQLGSHLNR
jgi:hypothetical protein